MAESAVEAPKRVAESVKGGAEYVTETVKGGAERVAETAKGTAAVAEKKAEEVVETGKGLVGESGFCFQVWTRAQEALALNQSWLPRYLSSD